MLARGLSGNCPIMVTEKIAYRGLSRGSKTVED